MRPLAEACLLFTSWDEACFAEENDLPQQMKMTGLGAVK